MNASATMTATMIATTTTTTTVTTKMAMTINIVTATRVQGRVPMVTIMFDTPPDAERSRLLLV